MGESLIGSQTWNIVLNLIHEFVLLGMRGSVLSVVCVFLLVKMFILE